MTFALHLFTIYLNAMTIDLGFLSYAFVVGAVAFFNPCGFAMLPAFVAHYLAAGETSRQSLWQSLLRAASLGLLVSAGFLTVFGLVGILFSLLRGLLVQYAFWIGASMGFLLIILGLLMLLGRDPFIFATMERLADSVSRLHGRGSEKSTRFYYFYGVSYALASLGCCTPIFLAVMGSSFMGGWLNGLVQFGAYGTGMATMMLAVSLITAISKNFIKTQLPKIMAAFRWIGGLVVLGAGLYLIWYNLIYSGVLKL